MIGVGDETEQGKKNLVNVPVIRSVIINKSSKNSSRCHIRIYHGKKIKDFTPEEDKALEYAGLWEKILSQQR